MANTDLTRQCGWVQKKTTSLFADLLVEGANPKDGEVPATTANYLVGNLPEDAVVTNAYVMVLTASDAATTAVAKLGTAEAGTQILSAANLKVLGKAGTFTGYVSTGTGVEVYLTLTYTGAATTVGKYFVVIEYDEPLKATGEFTPL
jgi:hypothetical protein